MAFVFSFFVANAQKVSNVKATENSGKITINYDLQGLIEGEKYKVEIYSSADNYAEPLKYVSGDVGGNVVSGVNKKVLWDASIALQTFKGEIVFEIKAVQASPIEFTNRFSESYKVKKSINVKYTGFIANEQSYFLLYNSKDSLKLSPAPSAKNESILVLPKTTKKGTYQLKLVNPVDKQVAISPEIRIKKGKLAVKIIVPLVILGGAGAYFLLNGGETPASTENKVLPSAPQPN